MTTVEDAFYEAGVALDEVVDEPMEAVLFERWLDKVARGLRQPE